MEYDDKPPTSQENPIPGFLKILYPVAVLWGLLTLLFFWDGSWGIFDGGSWRLLQHSANTTWPFDQSTETPLEPEPSNPTHQ